MIAGLPVATSLPAASRCTGRDRPTGDQLVYRSRPAYRRSVVLPVATGLPAARRSNGRDRPTGDQPLYRQIDRSKIRTGTGPDQIGW
jgi:hypothetical protein